MTHPDLMSSNDQGELQRQLVALVPELCDYAESATLEDDPLPECVVKAKTLLAALEKLQA